MRTYFGNILDAQNITVNHNIKDTKIDDRPLGILSYGCTIEVECDSIDANKTDKIEGRIYYKLLYLQKGSISIQINRKNMTFGENTLFLFCPGDSQTLHYNYNNQSKMCKRMFVNFSGTDVENILKKYNITQRVITFQKPLHIFESLILQMHACPKNEFRQRYCDLLLEQLLISVSNQLRSDTIKNSNDVSNKNKNSFDTLINMMQANYTKNIAIKEYADFIGFSEAHFNRFFKKAMNISPHKYIIKLRMEKAGTLLLSTQNSIKSIAFQVGYVDQHHFSKSFCAYFGISPSEYREKGIQLSIPQK